MATDVKVPALGESITEATLGAWLKQPGDAVAVGAVIARVEEGGASAAPARTAATPETGPVNPPGAGENPALRGDEHAPVAEPAVADAALTLSPAVRRAVLEHHVDPSKIQGTGKDGRLTKDDVLAAAKQAPST